MDSPLWKRGVRGDFIKNFNSIGVKDDLLQSAVLQKLTIIGEAAARLPKEFRERHSEIEWEDIIGFRNIAVHAYFAVEWSIVWVAATQEVPDLKRRIADILEREYAESG